MGSIPTSRSMKNTTAIGDISVAMITAALLRAQYVVLRPFGDGLKYDLVIEKDGEFKKVQCKTAVYKKETIKFNGYSVTAGGKRITSYVGHVDFFGVYAPELDKSYLFPVQFCTMLKPTFRVGLPKNNQQRRIKYAADFEILGGPPKQGKFSL